MSTLKDAGKNFQEEVSEKSREIWLAGLGLFSTAGEEGKRVFNELVNKGDDLVKKGEEFEQKSIEYSRERRTELEKQVRSTLKTVEEKFEGAIDALGLNRNDDKAVKELSDKVDQLTAVIADLNKRLGTADKPKKTARKTSANV